MDDGNTLHGMELALSIFTFPVRQQSFYPAIIGRNNGVVNLFKTTQQAARRREESSNNPITTAMEENSSFTCRITAIPVTPLPPPPNVSEVVRAYWEYTSVLYTILKEGVMCEESTEAQCVYAMNV